ncbi:MAG: glycine betaine/proline transport system substrate-binding protein [Solirubrobacteraceae bacterium]|jgi:glycine betaine/proline transport system substrate-binding protein|nr:glycine betaine/proline transport system substrate-binding protein [Solirubrobacteraceae bacterium]
MRPVTHWLRLLAPLAATVCMTAGLVACGSADDSGSSAAGGGKGIELKVGQFSWTAAQVETQVLAEIARAHPDLGVSSVKAVPVDPAPGWVGIQRGDIDVLPEVNLPNQQTFADKAKADVDLTSETYGGATQGWFVPRYAVEGADAPAKGLTSVDQLNHFKGVFDRTLYDADPGWVTTQQNTKRLKGFALDFKHSTSSEAALIAQLKRAYAKKQPILLYFYHPSWIFSQFQLVQLKEPKPYSASCFTGSDDACAIPTLAAWIAARKDLAERAPKFAAALKNVKIPLADLEKILDQVDQKGVDAETAAKQWVEEHKSEVDQWVS